MLNGKARPRIVDRNEANVGDVKPQVCQQGTTVLLRDDACRQGEQAWNWFTPLLSSSMARTGMERWLVHGVQEENDDDDDDVKWFNVHLKAD